MKTFLHQYFYFTRMERNGALLLCMLCVACFTMPLFFRMAVEQPKSPDFKAQFAHFTNEEQHPELVNTNTILSTATLFKFNPNTVTKEDWIALGLSPKLARTIENYRNKGGQFRRKEDLLKIYGMKTVDYERLESYIELNSGEKPNYTSKNSYQQKPAVLFRFNPNTATESDFVKLGLSTKTAATIVKYRERGGTFRAKEDLQKIYSLSNKDYERLLPYIQIENVIPLTNQKPTVAAVESKSPNFKKYPATNTTIDINQADAAQWQTLRGIGAAYAKRITNFREKLGGFSSIEQVKETFGLPDSTFQMIKTQLKPSPVLKTIALNTASVQELDAHPYIDARKAAALVSYREQHGAFKSLEDLNQLKALPADWIEKIKPYLRLD